MKLIENNRALDYDIRNINYYQYVTSEIKFVYERLWIHAWSHAPSFVDIEKCQLNIIIQKSRVLQSY